MAHRHHRPVRTRSDHTHVLTRLFEELVEEPSNILFTTTTGPETTRYDAMDATFWLECLDLMEAYGTMPSH
jgi:alpha-galactosidase